MVKNNIYKRIYKELKKGFNFKIDSFQEMFLNHLKVEDRKYLKEEDLKCYMDEDNIFGVVPKTKQMSSFFENNTTINCHKLKLNKFIRFEINEFSGVVKSRYNTNYLRIIFNIIGKDYKNIDISMKKDSPIKIEVDDLIFLIAPILSP